MLVEICIVTIKRSSQLLAIGFEQLAATQAKSIHENSSDLANRAPIESGALELAGEV